jgi:chromosomal replication initiator protein
VDGADRADISLVRGSTGTARSADRAVRTNNNELEWPVPVDDKLFNSTLLEVWDRATTRFDMDDSLRPQHKAWLRLTRPLGLVHDTAVLAAPNEYVREYLDANLRTYLANALSTELGNDVQVAVTVRNADGDERDAERTDDDRPALAVESTAGDPYDGVPDWAARRAEQASARHARTVERNLEKDARDARLNPRYTFDTFVIGSSNRFTHAAAVAVAEAPARAYNPFFIYGESGLGKTHLLHAIGHYAQSLLPGLRTRYVSSEEFTNDFINSVRDDKMQAFQARYRSVDLLLIDDIQFIERAERTQEEFFHTFNTLHSTNKQIVISSDKPPRQLKSLEDRLRTRFESGLISDVQTPDLETRIAILRKKAAQEGMNLPDEVLEFIATRIQSNIRELEGALIRVTAFASLNRQMVDMKLTESVLKDLVGDLEAPDISAATIMAVTSDYFGVSVDDLVGPSRSRALVHARQIAMYLCRELTDLSLPRIGDRFGGRDHTTVMHGERQIKTQMAEKLTTYNQISELTGRIKLRSRN